jgi:hypothetical protein
VTRSIELDEVLSELFETIKMSFGSALREVSEISVDSNVVSFLVNLALTAFDV